MPRKRPKHNPHHLRCPFASCRQWFRNQSGLTKHIRSARHRDSGPPEAPQTRRSLPPQSSPSPSVDINQLEDTFDKNSILSIQPSHQEGPLSQARELSPAIERSSTPEGDELISKIFHLIIIGLYIT